ncbi:hypothetical protein BYT27DRAFT_7252799 [Phlegmacium glaucopus]|nr:hypothetical protein BYT27DRAFT_7252799 [Phlegmacium glaucopus]
MATFKLFTHATNQYWCTIPAGVPRPSCTPAARSSQPQPAVGITPTQSQNSTAGHHTIPTTTALGVGAQSPAQSPTLSPLPSPARLPTPLLPPAQSLTEHETKTATGPVDATTSPETTTVRGHSKPSGVSNGHSTHSGPFLCRRQFFPPQAP